MKEEKEKEGQRRGRGIPGEFAGFQNEAGLLGNL